MSEQRNLLLAVVLSMAVVFGWQYFVGAPKITEEQARQQQIAQLQKGANPAAPPGTAPGAGTAPQATHNLPRDVALKQASERATIDTPTLDGSVNLTGGRFDDLRLRTYRETPDPNSPEIELLSPMASEHPYFAEFGWIAAAGSEQKTPGADTQWKIIEGDKLSPGHDVTLGYDNDTGLTFSRRLSVDKNFMFTITDTVDNHGAAPVVLYPYGLVARHNLPVAQHYWVVHEGFIGVLNGTLNDPTYAALDKNNDMQKFDSQGGWLGITDKYWMAAAIPPQSEQFTATYKAYDANGVKAYQSDFTMKPKTIAPNGSQVVIHHLFAGAKVVDVVNNYEKTLGIPRFGDSVDWGMFPFFYITKPMFMAIDFLYRYVGNFGIAILIFTVFVKALFFPLANASYRSMSKMKKLQPEMERMRERFKDDKVQQQQEMMKLYQKEKVNPLAGCLPMLIQIPVFFSLYKVLLVTIDMRHAPFFGWIKDLSAQDPSNLFNLFGLVPVDPTQVPVIGHFLVLGAFPMLMGLTMWIQTNLNPPPADPMQQKIFGFMPLLFMFMMAAFPVGLVIYWSWNNLLSIIQQVVIMKSTGTPVDFLDRLRGMAGRLRRGEAPKSPPAHPIDAQMMADTDADEAQRAAEEKGRILFAQECEFLRGAASLDGIPPAELPEVAFVGRSNVGKSSLVNALTGRKTLARVSNTPGRTREINFFRLGGQLSLADLPGYGYARVSRSDSERWTELIFAYLRGRPNLRRAVLLIDSRRGLLPQDIEVMTLLDRSAVSYQLVLTKVDKLKAGELVQVEQQTLEQSRRQAAAHPELIATSAEKGDEIAQLRSALAALATPLFSRRGAISLAPTGEIRMSVQDETTREGNLRLLARWRATSRVLVEALPFILQYDNKIIVVKYGGHAMEGGVPKEFAEDIVLMKQTGINPVVVHGGGPQIGAMLKRLNIPSSFVDGLRVTDAAAMEVVEMVLSGTINKQIVAGINAAGGRAVGVSGKDGNMVVARKLERTKRDPKTGERVAIDLGFVGEPERVDAEVLRMILNSDLIPVVAPIGVGPKAETYNINADTVAGAVAGAIAAERLVLLTDVEGVLDREGKLISHLTVTQARALIEDGTISGGMIPKIETAIDAVEKGVHAAVILDGRIPHVLLLELFTEHGAGTLIKPD